MMDNTEKFLAAWRNLTYGEALDMAVRLFEHWQEVDGDTTNYHDFARMMQSVADEGEGPIAAPTGDALGPKQRCPNCQTTFQQVNNVDGYIATLTGKDARNHFKWNKKKEKSTDNK